MSSHKIDSWSEESLEAVRSADVRMFPTEHVLRTLFSSDYFASRTGISRGMRVLDVGCLYANNLVPFHDRGLALCGIEVNDDMVALAKRAATRWGIEADIRKGTNTDIPFEDGSFDIALSINTLHYEDDLEGIGRALQEFDRVGNDACHYVIATASSDHDFHRTATRLSENKYRLNTNEFRNGQVMSYFDSKGSFESALSKRFGSVEIATITESYPNMTLGSWVAKCSKNRRGA